VPSRRCLVETGRTRQAFQPGIKFLSHCSDEYAFVYSLPQVFAKPATVDVPGRFYLDRRHVSTDGVDDLVGDALGILGTRLGLIQARI
jgi:hypothetical protein